MIRTPATQKLLQEPIVTIRDGRFVVPVKAEHRGEVPGLVHDTSSSGATVFIEPMGVVEANNELKVLRSREAAEIERIVQELSAQAGSFADAIIADYEVLVELNLIFAKARLAYAMKATRPRLTSYAPATPSLMPIRWFPLTCHWAAISIHWSSQAPTRAVRP